MSKLSFMFIGDVHLGRVSPRLPQDFAAYDLDPAALTPAAALSMSVRYAVERGVSGVIFAGDVVDEMNDAYGALAHLQAAIKVLADAGIPTL